MLPAIAVSSAVLLAGETVRTSDYGAPIPRRSGERDSKGTSPFGAVRVGPRAAQAEKAANLGTVQK